MKVDRQARTAIDIDISGDNTVIAAPGAGKFIEIDHLDFLCSGGANTVRIKDGSSSVIARYSLDDAQGYNFDFNNPDRNTIKLSVNTAFVINNYSGGQIEGFCLYRIAGE